MTGSASCPKQMPTSATLCWARGPHLGDLVIVLGTHPGFAYTDPLCILVRLQTIKVACLLPLLP